MERIVGFVKRKSVRKERNIEEIGSGGTLRRERLERADTEILGKARRCLHGEWLR
jgi:hypothetical protein